MAQETPEKDAPDDANRTEMDGDDAEKAREPAEDGKDYAGRLTLREDAAEVYEDVVQGFKNKDDRDKATAKYWDIYNCKITEEQSYNGRSQIFVPVVRDAIEARTLRFSNAVFPSNGRYVECVSSTGDNAHALQALINHYVRGCRLRETIGSCLRAGDVSGQYSVYCGWTRKERKITQRVSRSVDIEPGMPHPTETVEDVEQVVLSKGSPDIWVIPDEDLCVLPATVDDIDDADVVCVAMRVTKSWMRERKKDFTARKYKQAMAMFDKGGSNAAQNGPERTNPEKERAKDAGIRTEKGQKILLLYQIWSTMEIDGEWVPAVTLHCGSGEENVLSVRKNPYWGQRCPVISAPVKKVAGSFWGISPTASVEKLQYQANDAINMGMDSAQYALTPIVLTDPVSNPRMSTMVLEMAALWEANPNSTKILEFPKLWQDALAILSATKAQIHESLGLNPAMMPSGATKKTSQAAVAQEQALALEGTADAVRVLEEFILSRLAERIFEYDQQYRDEELTIPHFGELGYEALQEKVPPVQFGSRYTFMWAGITQNQNAQRVQQMIATMNVLRGIPPDQLNGRKLDVGPVLDAIVDVVYGPRLGPRVLKDVRGSLSMDPRLENDMLAQNMPVDVSPLDDDAMHMQVHHETAAVLGDPTHMFATHMLKHQAQMQKKAQAAAGPAGSPGIPGGAGPGVPGAPPRIGAQPRGPNGAAQQPPGAIHPDQMQDPARMPR